MLGGESAETKLNEMLQDLARVDDTDVMLIQDQLDVTCAIAIQTSAQKLMFKAWGQSLAMDWTHGTNNLGYHI
ncbi:hypothetical protein PybrP1_007704, partial [[Pythium] brassicae (nom. inval.)]